MLDSPRPRSPNPSSYNDKYSPSSSSTTGTLRRKSGLKSRATQILAIRFGWVVLVIWYEVGDFFHALSTCRFPDSELLPLGKGKGKGKAGQTSHLVLLADPHVPHPRLSYGPDSRPWINALRQGMDELFMRKSWNVVMRLGRVDGVVVVGDMLDWGRGDMSDKEYDEYHTLFRSIFTLPPSVPMHFVPGNHDLPLGTTREFSPYARNRYAKYFSPPNSVLPIANHSLILLDAVGLVEEDYRRYAAETQFGEWDGVAGGVIEFVKGLGDDPPPGPKILISHIPLARPEASRCGPLRERGRILKGAGPGYQNLLGSETSRFLLDILRPVVVFSGDDHDYCEHKHPQGVREVTLKSFSSSTGIRRPGFQLLSLIPPHEATTSKTHADRPCFLPDQAGVYYAVYLPVAILTFVYLFSTNIKAAWRRWNAAGHSIYGDLKSRMSPHIASSEFMPNSAPMSRRVSERPVPLTLPSRKSSQHLNGLGSGLTTGGTTPRSGRSSGFALRTASSDYLSTNFNPSARSAPVSPTSSPRPSLSHWGSKEEEEVENYDASPSMSRRSSYIYMNGHSVESTPTQRSVTAPIVNGNGNGNGNGFQSEPTSYFLPIPGNSGLGISSPNPIRRSSSNLSNLPFTMTPSPNTPYPHRRVTAPRMLSTADWQAAAKAKDKSVIGLLADSIPKRTGGWGLIKGFVGWLWRSRNGVVAKSWRECLAVAWPAGVVWVLVNALFFYS